MIKGFRGFILRGNVNELAVCRGLGHGVHRVRQHDRSVARARVDVAVDQQRASNTMFDTDTDTDTDPDGALDAVRRALTHARDAEVLARY